MYLHSFVVEFGMFLWLEGRLTGVIYIWSLGWMSMSYYFSLLVFLGIVLFDLHYSLDGHS